MHNRRSVRTLFAWAGLAASLASSSCGSDDTAPGASGGNGGSSGAAGNPSGSAGAPVDVCGSTCGNNLAEPGEACDGADTSGNSCASVGPAFTGGTLACKPDCSAYDFSQCQRGGKKVEAPSCEQAQVQAAIDSAADGDTVVLPAGTCTWTTLKEMEPAVIVKDKALTLQGAGADKTIIVDGTIAKYGHEDLLGIEAKGKPVRITGIGFEKVNDYALTMVAMNFRVDHCRIEHLGVNFEGSASGGTAVSVNGYSYGVVDHCDLKNCEVDAMADEDAAFSRPLSLGTANAVYVEDCRLTSSLGSLDDAMDGRSGGRFVLRHSSLRNLELHFHGIEGGGDRGIHSYELYDNTLIDDGINAYEIGKLRGGTGVVFNNTMKGDWWNLHIVHFCAPCSAASYNCEGPKACTTYPCKDQIGRTTDSDQDGKQDLAPLFEWNNKRVEVTDSRLSEDVDLVVQDTCADMTNLIKEGRDFYNDVVEYDVQAKCYKATYADDKGSPRSWTYKPYVYPHPLTTGE